MHDMGWFAAPNNFDSLPDQLSTLSFIYSYYEQTQKKQKQKLNQSTRKKNHQTSSEMPNIYLQIHFVIFFFFNFFSPFANKQKKKDRDVHFDTFSYLWHVFFLLNPESLFGERSYIHFATNFRIFFDRSLKPHIQLACKYIWLMTAFLPFITGTGIFSPIKWRIKKRKEKLKKNVIFEFALIK